MEKLYINISEPLGNKKLNKRTQKIYGFVIIAITLCGIISAIIQGKYGSYFFLMITYLVWGLLLAFQDRNSFYGNNFISVDSEILVFKLGMTQRRKELLWKDVNKVIINLTSVSIDHSGGKEGIKTDWILYKDVKELKSAIRRICNENKITLNES